MLQVRRLLIMLSCHLFYFKPHTTQSPLTHEMDLRFVDDIHSFRDALLRFNLRRNRLRFCRFCRKYSVLFKFNCVARKVMQLDSLFYHQRSFISLISITFRVKVRWNTYEPSIKSPETLQQAKKYSMYKNFPDSEFNNLSWFDRWTYAFGKSLGTFETYCI